MEIRRALGARPLASWASITCVAVLLTACNSSSSSAVSPATSTASTTAATPVAAGSTAPASSAAPLSAPASTAGVTASPAGADTFLAAGQDLDGTLWHEPACGGFGCALSGDSTTFLAHMTWTTWSGTEAVGAGSYEINDCHPDCAAGRVYPVATVVTLSQPVKVCSASGTRWVWSHASFAFPDGLPQALQGQNAPQNPWTFSALISAAQQSCS